MRSNKNTILIVCLFLFTKFFIEVITSTISGVAIILLKNDTLELTVEYVQELVYENIITINIISKIVLLLIILFYILARYKSIKNDLRFKGYYKGSNLILFSSAFSLSLIVTGIFYLLPKDILNLYLEQNNLLIENNHLLFIIFTLIIKSIVEELFYRGIIFNEIKKSYPVTKAIVLASFIYGYTNSNFLWLIYTLIFGMYMCYLYEKTDSFNAVVIYHVVFNIANLICGKLIVIATYMPYILLIVGFICFYLNHLRINEQFKRTVIENNLK